MIYDNLYYPLNVTFILYINCHYAPKIYVACCVNTRGCCSHMSIHKSAWSCLFICTMGARNIFLGYFHFTLETVIETLNCGVIISKVSRYLQRSQKCFQKKDFGQSSKNHNLSQFQTPWSDMVLWIHTREWRMNHNKINRINVVDIR